MKTYLLLLSLCFLFMSFSSMAQTPDQEKPQPGRETLKPAGENLDSTLGAIKPPAFPGGEAALKKFLKNNMQYPRLAKKNGVQGTVAVSFTVDEQGNLSEVKLLKDVGAGLGEEALRLVGLMPKWEPGTQNGQPVRMTHRQAIRFEL